MNLPYVFVKRKRQLDSSSGAIRPRELAQVVGNKKISPGIQKESSVAPDRTVTDPNHSKFIERLKAAIGDTSVRQFASRAGLSAQTVTNVLNGSEPTRPTLLAIAMGSGLSIDWLVSGLGTPSKSAQDISDDDLGLAMSCFVAITEMLQETGRDASFEKKKILAINMFRREKERRSGQEPAVAGRGALDSTENRA